MFCISEKININKRIKKLSYLSDGSAKLRFSNTERAAPKAASQLRSKDTDFSEKERRT